MKIFEEGVSASPIVLVLVVVLRLFPGGTSETPSACFLALLLSSILAIHFGLRSPIDHEGRRRGRGRFGMGESRRALVCIEGDESEFNAIDIEFFAVKKGIHPNEKTY